MKGYIVIGPEGSGTRLFTKILVKAGCDGDYSHEQRFDVPSISEENYSKCKLPLPIEPVVLRRSVPHGSHLVNISELISYFINYGYEPYIIIILRDWFSIANSQLKRQRVENHKVYNRIECAYRLIFNHINKYNFHIVNYENIINNCKSVNSFLKIIGLKELEFNIIKELDLKNENLKYYKE